MDPFKIALVGGLAGMLGYGLADFFAKKAVDRLGNLKALFYSQFFAGLLTCLYFLKDASLPSLKLSNILAIFAFGFFNTIGYLLLYRAFQIGKLSIVSPISSTFVVLAAILSFLFFGETFSQTKIFALILVVAGIVLTAVNLKELRNGIDISDLSKGVPEALLVFLIFGFYVPFWDRFIEGSGWVFWVIAVRIIVVLLLLIYGLFIKKESLALRRPSILTLLFIIAFFEAIAGFGNSWAYNASANTTSIITAITSSYPMVTATLAFFVLKERLAINQYVGVFSIITGLFLMPFV